jgi:two-component system, chemotaxis family, sensor kinase CheA
LSDLFNRESMLEMYLFETLQLIEQLELSVLKSEKSKRFEPSSINEIFRIMHTIKGSSAMMMYNNIAALTHCVEDVFDFLRKDLSLTLDHSLLTDIVLEVTDFIKIEVSKIQNADDSSADPAILVNIINDFLNNLKLSKLSNELQGSFESTPTNHTELPTEIIQGKSWTDKGSLNKYEALLFFEDGCQMENIRAYAVIHRLQEIAEDVQYYPADIIDNEATVDMIRKDGFVIKFRAEGALEEVRNHLLNSAFIKDLEVRELLAKQINLEDPQQEAAPLIGVKEVERDQPAATQKQSMISVSVTKLDTLMDLVGEMVIAEAMVTQNPELAGLTLDSFHKASRQLKKITGELQDIVMSIRMVELSTTFQKLNRIVRDMSKKLDKDVELVTIGEDTEVDKNIIEQISDPLMHLIRNSLDHGVEMPEERKRKGKPSKAQITLEARNAGSEVWIVIRDDGKGLDKEKILQKARANGLIHKPENELNDQEIYSFIFLPGFSTNEVVTEYSGRGVGMDVVTRNIQSLGGTVSVDSIPTQGTTFTVKIPLTLAIIDGMTIRVGNLRYTVPTTSIKQSFKLEARDVIRDPDGNEMIMIRGQCHRIIRLHEIFKVPHATTELHEGIIMMVESEGRTMGIFADELIDKQQVVVKTLPAYIKKIKGIAGCTLLGDGNISLILDTSGLFQY